MIKEIKSTKKAIEYCLLHNAATRNSDQALFCDVCRLVGVNVHEVTIEQLCFNHAKLHVPHFETVRRMRQKFQAQGLYLPTENVNARRKEEEKLMRQYMKKEA